MNLINATIITIGDELLIGQTINTNASWLGQELSLIGCNIIKGVTISDTKDAITNALDIYHMRARQKSMRENPLPKINLKNLERN
mgnify:CR=1 FL=1